MWRRLERPAKHDVKTTLRVKRDRVKENIVVAREYLNIVWKNEDVAEFDYKPTACKQSYRMIVIRKNLSKERGERVLIEEILYFFCITNDRDSTAEDVMFSCHDRCHQENVIEQLKNGPRALRAPVNNLYSNWACMVTDFTLEIKQPLSEPLSLATRKQGSRSSTIAGKIHPSEKICRFYRATGTYCLTLKDIQMFCDLVYQKNFRGSSFASSICDARFAARLHRQ